MNWNRLSEAKPQKGQRCLVYENSSVWVAYWNFWAGIHWGFCDGQGGTFPKATHWMELPGPPGDDDE